jgi:hypothetical protein
VVLTNQMRRASRSGYGMDLAESLEECVDPGVKCFERTTTARLPEQFQEDLRHEGTTPLARCTMRTCMHRLTGFGCELQQLTGLQVADTLRPATRGHSTGATYFPKPAVISSIWREPSLM